MVPAVPGEERRVAVPVGHVEGPAEGLDAVVGEERRSVPAGWPAHVTVSTLPFPWS